MTQFTYMAIKVADEDQFNQVAEKLRGMGHEVDDDPEYGSWHDDAALYDTHVLTHMDGEFGLYSYKGLVKRTRYTYEQFMQL